MGDNSSSRRRFLATSGTAITALVAGCLSLGNDDGSTPTETPESTPTQTAEPTPTRTLEPTPTETPEPTPTQTPEPTPTPTAEELAADAFASYTRPLETVDPTAPLDDLDFLQEELADASIVGMGEATHGTREFFQFKHRLVRYLAEELGLRTFAWEANFAESLAIDQYIRTGDGDPVEAINGVYFWTWSVESVLSMIEWMRTFNEGRAPEDKIRFYGVDAQFAAGQIDELEAFFEAVDDDALAQYSDLVSQLRSETPKEEGAQEARDRTREFVSDLESTLEANESEYVDATSQREYDLARRYVTVLEQYVDLYDATHADDNAQRARTEIRDRAMAENARWVLEREQTDTLALWMHNSHVNRNPLEYEWTDDSYRRAGFHLAEWYGDEYYVVGMEFGRGSFQAKSASQENRGELTEFTVEPAYEYALPGVLSTQELSYAYVDLDAASHDDELTEWLAEPPRRTSIGAVFHPEDDRFRYTWDPAPGDFDGLLFVEETERSRPL
jgi:erythromycin esterase